MGGLFISLSLADVSLASLLSIGVLSTAGKATDSKINNVIILKSTHKPCDMMLCDSVYVPMSRVKPDIQHIATYKSRVAYETLYYFFLLLKTNIFLGDC